MDLTYCGAALASLLIERGDYKAAERTLRAVIPQDPGGEIAAELGYLKLRARDYNDSVRWYSEAVRAGRTDAITFRNYAQAATGAGDLRTAENAFQDGIKANPSNPDLLVNAGLWYEKQSRRLTMPSASFGAACKLPPSETYQPEYDCASLLVRLGRFNEAIALLSAGIAKRPSRELDTFELERMLGTVLIQTGKIAEARKAGRRGTWTASLHTGASKRPGPVAKPAAQNREALLVARSAELSQYIKGEMTGVDATLMAADPMEYAERLKTRRAMGSALSEPCYLNLANSSKDERESIAIIEEGIKHYPKAFDLRANLAMLLLRKGKKNLAKSEYERAISLFDEDAQKAVADCKNPIGTGLKGEAFDRSLRFSGFPFSFVGACFTYLAEDGRDSAISKLQERILRAPVPLRKVQQEQAPSLHSLDLSAFDRQMLFVARVSAEMQAGRFSEALATIRKLEETTSVREDPMLLSTMARCLRQVGRDEESIDCYRRAMKPNSLEPGLVFDFLSAVAAQRPCGRVQ